MPAALRVLCDGVQLDQVHPESVQTIQGYPERAVRVFGRCLHGFYCFVRNSLLPNGAVLRERGDAALHGSGLPNALVGEHKELYSVESVLVIEIESVRGLSERSSFYYNIDLLFCLV